MLYQLSYAPTKTMHSSGDGAPLQAFTPHFSPATPLTTRHKAAEPVYGKCVFVADGDAGHA